MKMLLFRRSVIAIAAAVMLLAGCAGPQATIGAPGVPATVRASWMAPHHGGRNLLYLSYDGSVAVYTYPGAKFLGTLTGFQGAFGLCVDKSGDIFVPFIYGVSSIYEFPHGGSTPIAQIGFPYGNSEGCSVNPVTKALAVLGGDVGPYVTIYHYSPTRQWLLGRSYAISGLYKASFGGYDSHGNLFVDGPTSRNSGFALTELAKGSHAFTTVTPNQSISAPGGVQWDGEHLAVGDSGVSPSVIYQFDVSGSAATKVGETILNGSKSVEQFWIQGRTVVAPDSALSCQQSETGCVQLYRYPAGGAPTKTFPLRSVFGSTVSLAK